MKEIENLIQALKKSRRECPWSREQDMREHFLELEREIKEAREALDKNDPAHLKEELGDVLMDLIFISILADEKKLFSLQDMLESANKKLRRRKPWVFGDEKVHSKEDAVRRWNEIKAKERKE